MMTTDAVLLARPDSVALRVAAWLAALTFALGLVGIGIAVVTALAAPTLTFDDLVLANGARPGFADSVDAVTAARYSTATLDVEGVPAGVRWLLAASSTVLGLPGLAIGALMFILGRRFADGADLLPQAAVGSGVAALVAFASALFGPFLRGVAEAELVRWLDLAHPDVESPMVFLVAIRADALALPTVLLLLSAALHIAARLQRDTRGLV